MLQDRMPAVTEVAGMAELADAADLKSAGPKGLWGFESPSRHQLHQLWFDQLACWAFLKSASHSPSGNKILHSLAKMLADDRREALIFLCVKASTQFFPVAEPEVFAGQLSA